MRGRGGRGNFRGGRPDYANRGRPTYIAESRVAFVEKNKTNSARRLQRDMKELLEAKEPLVGVSARPLPDNMYEWHGNLRGPAGTKWAEGVFHIKIEFPIEYPVKAPLITLYTTIPHPNVFANKLCLDMLENTGEGKWISAYTVEAILIQLQSFLFEKMPEDIHILKGITIDQAVKNANDFKCSTCKHKGPLSAWPPFYENEKNLKDFIMLKTPYELLFNEMNCFSTKLNLREATMGIGISLKKSPRTGSFIYVNPTIDLLSMRAFTKLKIRTALHGEKFTHWLPLFFGENEEFQLEKQFHDHQLDEMVTETKTVNLKERFEKHLFNSLRFICNGSKDKPISVDQQITLMSRLIMTHVVDLTKENRHISIVAIRRLLNFIRLFLYLIEKDPSIQKKMDEQLESFIKDPEKRVKDDNACPNLGDILIFITLSSKFKIKDALNFYVDEQLDRQVYWMIQKVPELDFQNKKLKNKGKVDEKQRVKVCFECGRTGYLITTFFYHLNKAIEKITTDKTKNLQQFAKILDDNVGCMERKIENELQQKLLKSQAQETFDEYYKTLGIKVEGGEKGIYEKLIQSVRNSRIKKYHGDEDDENSKYNLPSVAEQSEKRVLKLLNQFTTVDSEKQEIDKKQDIEKEKDKDQIEEWTTLDKSSKKSLSQIDDSPAQEKTYKLKINSIKVKDDLQDDLQWKQLCIDNFDFIRQTIESNKNKLVTPAKFAFQDDYTVVNQPKSVQMNFKRIEDKLYQQRNQLNGNKSIENNQNTVLSEYDNEKFSYKQLFIKLVFEFIMNDLEHNQNFEIIYEFIKVFVDDLTCVKINILDKTSLKSNHYWLMAIIPKLTKLKTLKIYMDQNSLSGSVKFDQNGFKFLQKAVNYLYKNGGDLIQFEILSGVNQSSGELMSQIFKPMTNLQALKFADFDLSLHDCKAIGKILSDFMHIRELQITNSKISDQHAKEIADGLMRAKNIEVLNLRDNPNLVCEQIIYNLAFSPKIRLIDLTNVPRANSSGTAEAIFKLLKISGSIKVLLLGQTGIAKSLTQDFFIALGETKSLEVLDINYLNGPAATSDQLALPYLQLLGKACGLNAKRKGLLKELYLQRTIGTYNYLEQFLESFYVSDHDNEMWYGDKNVAKEMKKDQLEKNLHFGLKKLDLGDSLINISTFKLKDFEIQKEPNWPVLIKCLSQVPLNTLNLSNCSVGHRVSEVLAVSIGKNPVGHCQNLKILNLSKNTIGIEGAKLLAPALELNKSIEFLDLSSNQLMVYGVTMIAKSLEKNTALKGLNLFKNQFDVDGARALRELLKVNSTIEFLDIGHNRIRQKGLESIASGIQDSTNSNLKTLGLRLNFINDDGFKSFFEDVVFSGISKLENLYIRENNMSQQKALQFQQKLIEDKSQIYVDLFEKQNLLKDERTKKTIWFGPIDISNPYYPRQTIQARLQVKKCGLNKLPIRFKYGRKVQQKTNGQSVYMFVEYEDEKSINLITRFMKKGKISGISSKCYLAGTNTFVRIIKSKKGQNRARARY